MSSQFESNAGSTKNSLDQSEFPLQPDNLMSVSVNDSAISSYRSMRFIPPPDQVAASQAQLDKLGYGSFSLSEDSNSQIGTTRYATEAVQILDSDMVKATKAKVVSGETPEERSYTALSKDQAGGSVIGPYKLDRDTILSWISNLSKDELAVLPKMTGGISAEASAITKLNVLAQAYKQGQSPEQARQAYGSIVADPEVRDFLAALSSMAPGGQVDAPKLAKIFSPELQELIAGDVIRAVIQIDNASSPAKIDFPDVSVAGAPIGAGDAQIGTVSSSSPKDKAILPGPLQKI
ncbi:hypothetical protein BH10CYA1_BH10CYA1_18370 [soil metagenome]